MKNISKKQEDEKDLFKRKVGARIKQARVKAGFSSCAKLTAKLKGWSVSRLANYEQGINLAHPLDVREIAKTTNTSEAWILFGSGPVQTTRTNMQAIRYQNLDYIYREMNKAEQRNLQKRCDCPPMKEFIENPEKPISAKLCRKIEKLIEKPVDWFDEQHIEADGLSHLYPADLQEIMQRYSDMSDTDRKKLLNITRVLDSE